jgi:hypothetical protein
MGEVTWLSFGAKSQPLSFLGLTTTLDAKPKPTSTLKPGYQKLVESVVLDRCWSGYMGNHSTRIVLGGSTVAEGKGGVCLSYERLKTIHNTS